MKKLTLNSAVDIEVQIETITDAANEAQMHLLDMSASRDGIGFLEELKLQQIGCDPLMPERRLNLIEQVNQTFTYLASLKAAELLFHWHTGLKQLNLNLGTTAGSDIESSEFGGIAAEVFAATKPSSNNKLNKDIEKVSKITAEHKYVFFLCPNVQPGKYKTKNEQSVLVWSLES